MTPEHPAEEQPPRAETAAHDMHSCLNNRGADRRQFSDRIQDSMMRNKYEPQFSHNGRSNAITNLLGRSQPVTGLLASAALGAGLMYALDPNNGRRRRARARDKIVYLSTLSSKRTRSMAADVSNRAKGLFHQVKSLMRKHDHASLRGEDGAEIRQGVS